MLRVILIDDEPVIREGLKSIIDWNAYGFSVCGEASNGSEGFEKICKLLPDLAIVDVKMPVMDGFQMIRELRRCNISCDYIILSAYSDFKYAQSAIDLGIVSYLLKPIEQEELIEKIVKIRDSVLSRRQTQQYINMSVSLTKRKILKNLALGLPVQEDLEKHSDLYGLDFPWRSYQVGLIEMDKKSYESPDLREKLENEVEAFIASFNLGCFFSIDKYAGILFKNSMLSSYPRILSDLHDRIKRVCGLDVTIALGSPVNGMDSIKLSYKAACRLIEKKFIYGYKEIITAATPLSMERKNATHEMSIDAVIEDLYRSIDVDNIERLNDILQELLDYFTANETEEAIIKVHYSNIYTAIISRLVNSHEIIMNFLNVRQEILAEICNKTSLQELHGYIKFILASVAEELSKLRPNDPVKKILDYVDRNYQQDLKLEGLAVLFHYNSAYLGKLIRAKTGVHFSTYLDHVRIEKAKQLLREGYKVYEVAQKSGYRYIDYFYKKFKKYVGVSPTDYKENI